MRGAGWGRALAAILARAGFPPGPPAGVRCVPFPRHPTEVTRGPGGGRSSQQASPRRRDAQRAAAAQGERPLQARAGERRGGDPPDLGALCLPPSRALPRLPAPTRRLRSLGPHGKRFPETSWPRRWGRGVWAPALRGSSLGASLQAPLRGVQAASGPGRGAAHPRPSRERVTAVGGAGIEPAVLGSHCRCAGEFACVWCPVWKLDLPETLASNLPE